jgi:hypothetical protein
LSPSLLGFGFGTCSPARRSCRGWPRPSGRAVNRPGAGTRAASA